MRRAGIRRVRTAIILNKVRVFKFPILLACAAIGCQAQEPAPARTSAAELGRRVLQAGLDPTQCYRVRDLEVTRDEARIFLTDGYLVFGQPVNGQPRAAVFSGDTDGGDAQLLMLPPDQAERKSLAAYVGSPNLSEHFTQAAFIFTDDTAKDLLEQINAAGAKPAPDVGALMVDRWGRVVANLMTSFESRMVLDLLTPGEHGGLFEAVIQSKKLGNFDVLYDARGYEQLLAGQIAQRDGRQWWETWTSFVSRSHRGHAAPEPEQTILSYRIDASLDPTLDMRCTTRLRLRTTERSRNAIPFDLSGQMRAISAKVDGVPAELYERDSIRTGLVHNTGNELLLILPPTPLEPGTEHEIEIVHEGKVVVEAGHNVYFVGARGSWYPGRGQQFSKFDATFRYPKSLSLVSAGTRAEDRDDGEFHITRRVAEVPVRLFGFNLGQYECQQRVRDGITAEVCANKELEDALRPRAEMIPLEVSPGRGGLRRTPGQIANDVLPVTQPRIQNPVNRLTQIAEQIDEAMLFYRSKFGEPPLKRLEVTPVPGRFGQGFPGMLYLPTASYLEPVAVTGGATVAQQIYFRDLLIAHEVAHQWWGNIVTSGSYHHEWIMEALANYSAALYMESKLGPKSVETALEAYRKGLFQLGQDGSTSESEGPVVQGRRLENSNNPSAFVAVVYGKGTWIIHMLRRKLGDEQFFKMLGELRRRYELRTVSSDEFREVCAGFLPKGAADPKLETFFDNWVYGTGVPTLKLSSAVKGKPGAYKMTGTLTQSDVSEDFSVAVPVEIQTGKGKPVVQLVRTGSEAASFSVNVAIPNAKAVLDPGWSVLRR